MNPYQTPQAPPSTPQGPSGRYGFPRDNRGLSKVLIALFIGHAVLTVLYGVLTYMELQALHTPEGQAHWGSGEFGTLDTAMAVNGLLLFLVFVALVVIYCVWKNRSCKNAWLLNPGIMSYTPGWAVGWYFIPIANLFKPYGAMRQIRDASVGASRLTAALPTWWALWIITNIAENVSMRLSLSFDDLEKYEAASVISIAILPLNLILVMVVIHIIRTITSGQMTALLQMPAQGQAPVPGMPLR